MCNREKVDGLRLFSLETRERGDRCDSGVKGEWILSERPIRGKRNPEFGSGQRDPECRDFLRTKGVAREQ